MSHSLELNPRFLVDTAVDDLSGVTDPVAARTKLSVIRTVDTVAAVRLLSAAESVGVIGLSGYWVAGDKPMAQYYWDPLSVLVDDGGSVLKPAWVGAGAGRFRIVPQLDFDIAIWGVKYDGVDDANALETALRWGVASSKPVWVSGLTVIGRRVSSTGGSKSGLLSKSGGTIRAKAGLWGDAGRLQCVQVLDCDTFTVDGITWDQNSANTTNTAGSGWAMFAFETAVADLYSATVVAKRLTFTNNKIVNLRSYGAVARLCDGVVMSRNRCDGAVIGAVGFLRSVRCDNVDFVQNYCDGGSSFTIGQTGSWIASTPGTMYANWNTAGSDAYVMALNWCAVVPYLQRGQFTSPIATAATTDATVSYTGLTETDGLSPAYIGNDFFFFCDTAGSGTGSGIHNGARMKVISVNEGAKTFVVRLYDHAGTATNWAGQQVSWTSVKTSRFSKNVNVIGNTVRRSGEGGVFLLGCDGFKINDNTAIDHADICLDAEWSINGEILGNTARNDGTTNTGIASLFLQRNIRIANNVLVGEKAHILAYSGWAISSGLSITGNSVVGGNILCAPNYGQTWDELTENLLIQNNSVLPIRITGSNAATGGSITVAVEASTVRGGRHRNVLISGNVLDGSSQRAVILQGVQGCRIEDNEIRNTFYDAIYVGGTVTTQESTGIFVRRNRLDNIGKAYHAGMAILRTAYANTEDPIIEGNIWRNTDPALDNTQAEYIKNAVVTPARRSIESGNAVFTTALRPSAVLYPQAQIYNSSIQKPEFSNGTTWQDAAKTRPPVTTFNVSGAVSLNTDLTETFDLYLTGNITSLTFAGAPVYGQELVVIFSQGAAGSMTLSGVNTAVIGFAGGTLVLSTTAFKVDTLTFIFDGTRWREKSRALNV